MGVIDLWPLWMMSQFGEGHKSWWVCSPNVTLCTSVRSSSTDSNKVGLGAVDWSVDKDDECVVYIESVGKLSCRYVFERHTSPSWHPPHGTKIRFTSPRTTATFIVHIYCLLHYLTSCVIVQQKNDRRDVREAKQHFLGAHHSSRFLYRYKVCMYDKSVTKTVKQWNFWLFLSTRETKGCIQYKVGVRSTVYVWLGTKS